MWNALAVASLSELSSPTPVLAYAMAWLQAGVGVDVASKTVPQRKPASRASRSTRPSTAATTPLICSTTNGRRGLLEIAGLPVGCSVWFHPTARVEHLFDYISERFGDASLWRYTVQGRPIRPEDLLLGFRGGVLRVTPRVPGGGDGEQRDAATQAAAAAARAPGCKDGPGTDIPAAASASSSAVHVVAAHATLRAQTARQMGNPGTASGSGSRTPRADSRCTEHLLGIEHEEPLYNAQVQEERLADIPVPADGLCVCIAQPSPQWTSQSGVRHMAIVGLP